MALTQGCPRLTEDAVMAIGDSQGLRGSLRVLGLADLPDDVSVFAYASLAGGLWLVVGCVHGDAVCRCS